MHLQMSNLPCATGAESLTTQVEHIITSIPPPSAASAPQACGICRRQVSGPDRQNHMGRHILQKLRGVAELPGDINMGSVRLSSYVLKSLKLITFYTRLQRSTPVDFVVNQA